jgi:hypothetical protein
MSSKRSLKPHQLWDALDKMDLYDEAERVHALSDAELDDELAKKGIDPTALRSRAAELAATRKGDSPEQPVTLVVHAHPPERKRWVILIAAATLGVGAVAAAVPAIVLTIAKHGEIRPDPWESSTATREQRAAALRVSANAACEQQRLVECERALDEAQALDPAGEGSAEVRTLRRALDDARSKSAPPPKPQKLPQEIMQPRDNNQPRDNKQPQDNKVQRDIKP